MRGRTEPLPCEAEADERRWNGKVVDDGIDVHPTHELIVSGDQLQSANNDGVNYTI